MGRKGLLSLLAVLVLLLVACAQEEPAEYFQGAIPPCTPVGGVDVDPCEPRAFKETSAGLAGGESPFAEGDGTAPYTVRWYLGAKNAAGIGASHIVVRGTYPPGTIRCRQHDKVRAPTWTSFDDLLFPTTKCYVDVRVNEYYLGSGPSLLTVVVWEDLGARSLANSDQWFADIVGREEILFLGPGIDYAVETLEAFHRWDVQRDGDTAIAVHPWRDFWLRRGEHHRSSLEIPLSEFGAAVTAAHAVRLADYGGRVITFPRFPEVEAPMVQTDANKLHDFYVAAGAMDHPDGPPGQPPPSCGLAVPDPPNNGGLMLDCETLLAAKDTLRGTAALNWSVDVAMADWDGMRTRGTGRVTDIILVEKGLTGTVPAELAEPDRPAVSVAQPQPAHGHNPAGAGKPARHQEPAAQR